MGKLKLKKKFRIIFLMILTLLTVFWGYKFLFNKNEIKSQKPQEEKNEIKEISKNAILTFVGDFLYEEPYYNALKRGDVLDTYFSLVKDYFINDDLSVGNMEVVIGNENMKMSGSGFSFCAPESIGHQVISLDMEVLSTANNHSNDRGMEGRLSTIDFFEKNSDILTVGTYDENPRDVTKNIREVNGIKFGFLAYTSFTNVKVNEDFRYSLGLFKNPDGGGFDQEYQKLITDEVNELKGITDVLIVMLHWGNEFTHTPTDEQRNIAAFLNDLGVDIIVGSHSHSIQPIEWVRSDKHDTLVYYSLGNFVSADEDISRTGETFDNAYQFGLLSQLKVTLDDNEVFISNITTEPIINFYDKNFKNFILVPYFQYDENYEKNHYRYDNKFNKSLIENTYNEVIDEQFR